MAEVTPVTETCCTPEAADQVTDFARATAETITIKIEQEMATAVAQSATLTAERDATQKELIQLRSRELAAYSQGEGEVFPQRNLLLAMEALRITNEVGMPAEPVAENAFFDALSSIGGIGLHGHSADITAVAFSPDGHWLATASEDATVRLWDLTTPLPGASPITLPRHQTWINDLAISPDSRWLATTGAEGVIKLWDLTTIDPETTPVELRGHEYDVLTITFSPDNQWLISGGSDRTVQLWQLDDLTPNEATIVLSDHESYVENVVVSPDSRWLFTSSDNVLIRWDLMAKDIPGSLTMLSFTGLPLPQGHHISPKHVAVSPDGHWLAVGIGDWTGSSVQVWDLSTPELTNPALTLIENLDGSASALTFSLDSRFLAASESWAEQAIYIWDLTGADPAADPTVFYDHHSYVRSLAFSPDSQWLVSGSNDNLVRLWPFANKYDTRPIKLYGHEAAVGLVTFSPDKQWLVTASADWEITADNSVRLWDWTMLPHFQIVPKLLDTRKNWVVDLAISPDDRWLFALDQRLCDGEGCDPPGDAAAALWPLQTVDQELDAIELFQNEAYISATALSSDGRWLAVGGESQEAWLWDLTAPDPSKTQIILSGHTSQIDFIEFTPDNRWLVTASGYSIWTPGENDKTIRLWNINNSDPANILPIDLSGHDETIWGIRVSENGRWLLSWDGDAVLRVWDLWADNPALNPLVLETPQSVGTILTAVAISPDGQWLATNSSGQDNTVRLYDLTTSEPAANSLIITTYDFDPIRMLIEHTSVYFSEDGRWLITGRTNDGNSTQMWDLTATNPAATPLTLQCGRDHFVAISPNHRWILTSGEDLTLCLWDISNPAQGITPNILYDQPEFKYGVVKDSIYAQFTEDGRTLVTSTDDVVQFWDLTAPDINKSVKIIHQEGDFAWVWTVNSDGSWFVRVDDRSQIYLWDRLLDQKLIDVACQTVGRNLTRQEWHRYFDDEPYLQTCPGFPS